MSNATSTMAARAGLGVLDGSGHGATGHVMYLSDIPCDGDVRLFEHEPDVMKVPKVAELLGVVPQTVRREIQRGALECIHVGTQVRVTKSALLRYVKEA